MNKMANADTTGQLMAKSNVYNSMYFVSFRVHKVWKGRLPR